MEKKMNFDKNILSLLQRSTEALEKVTQINSKNKLVITSANGYLWDSENFELIPINVINAIKAAIKKEITVIIFSGEEAGKMNDYDCLKLKIKSKNVARIQEMHILVGHIICKYIEQNNL